jgi:pantoate--beta-alanine ligase
MNIVTNLAEWQQIRKTLHSNVIGFVPTMGNLHEGHASLLARAKSENEILISSLFINPTQFNQAADYDLYPRTLEQDTALLNKHNVDYLLLFTKKDLYPDDFTLHIQDCSELSQVLEGAHRPGHFTGVLTIVLKLFNLVLPTRAYFGEKDYQQLLLVQKMVEALFLNIEIIPCPTIRAEDGLALSSRNKRLTPEQRAQAALLPTLLKSSLSLEHIREQLADAGFTVDYVEEAWGRRLAAASLGGVRLIDNVALSSLRA